MTAAKKYSASEVRKLGALEAIRTHPGMYIGDRRGYGLNHILWEIISNAIDEATAGFGKRIVVTLRQNGAATVRDFGRGIPVEWKPEEKSSALSLVFMELHAGGKHAGSNSAYGSSGGMHGIGGKACNAFSAWLDVEVRRHGLKFRQRFEHGVPTSGVQVIDAERRLLGTIGPDTVLKTGRDDLAAELILAGQRVSFKRLADTQTGTELSFLPHRDYFDWRDMDWAKPAAVPWDLDGERGLRRRCRQTAFLAPGIRIELTDERQAKAGTEVYHSKDGLPGYLAWLNDGQAPLHKPISFRQETEIEASGKPSQIVTEVALQYAGDRTQVLSFVNTIPTPQGGKHVAAFQAALTKAVKAFAADKKLIKDEDLRPEDLNLGLTAIVNLTMSHTPQFQGQTKDALNSPEIHGPVFSATYDFLSAYLAKNIPVGKAIVNQAVASAHGRAAAQLARQQVMSRASGGLDDAGAELTIKKLADIQRKGGRPVVPLDETELHLVEGDSAGGAAKQGRDSTRHAILALRGKIPNVFELKLAKTLENQEIAAILRALGGVEANGNGTQFNVEAMNFGRCVITTDADVDGSHIRVLLMVMLWKLRPELVRSGRLYVARPPLYRIVPKKGEARYVYSDDERDAAVKALGGMQRLEKVQRFKGLGEMSAAEIAETLFSPEARANQVRVTVDDLGEVARTFELLMSGEVEPRKNWLMETWAPPA